MNTCLLLLVVVLAIFVGGDAVSASAALPNIETSKLSPSNAGHAVQTDNGGKRSLRGLPLIDDAANEERGVTEEVDKVMGLLSKFKVGQKLQSWAHKGGKDKKAEKMRLVRLDVDYETLFKKKVTPELYFDAMGFDPRLRHVGSRPTVLKNNPGFEKWIGYNRYWNENALTWSIRNRGG